MIFILTNEFSLNLKCQISLLSFSFEKFQNMSCSVQKTVVDINFHPITHEN